LYSILAAWAVQRQPLEDWLVSELTSERYNVPSDVAQTWVAEEQVLPLIDGLDEVALQHRKECVAAINEFQHQHGLVPLVVTGPRGSVQVL
jgi:predicted NACHT family NTPase